MVLPQATNYSLIIIHFSLFTKTNQQQVTANNYFKWWHAPCAEFYGFEKPLVLTPALTQPLSGERLASREKTYAYHSVIEPRGQKGKGEGGTRGQKVCFTEFYGFAQRNRRHSRRSKTLRLSRRLRQVPMGRRKRVPVPFWGSPLGYVGQQLTFHYSLNPFSNSRQQMRTFIPPNVGPCLP